MFGTTDTGHVHLTRALAGLDRITTGNASSRDIGKATEGASSTTIVGTVTATAITEIMIAIMIATRPVATIRM
jgi:hypothetical protein